MDSIRELRALFRGQLAFRGAVSAALTLLLVFGLGIITADLAAWWFDWIPGLQTLSTWIKAQNSWNLFLFMFVGVTLLNYVQQVQGVFLDRLNANVLIQLSTEELDQSDDPKAEMGKRRALLMGRRRLLESLLKHDPLIWSLVALALAFGFLGHLWAALFLFCAGIFIVLLLPHMIAGFNARRGPQTGEEDLAEEEEAPSLAANLSPKERREQRQRAKDPVEKKRLEKERAQQNLADASQKMMVLVERPLIRLKVGWPGIVVAVLAVVGVVISTLTEMWLNGDLPEKGTLLLMLLVLTANISLRMAQSAEDLAFFASMVQEVSTSENGSESL